MNIQILTVGNATSGSGSDLTWVNLAARNQTWRILFGHAALTSSATVGNRRFKLVVYNADGTAVSDIMSDSHAGAVQAASLTRHYSLKQGIYRETAFIDDDIELPITRDLLVLPGG